MNRAGGRLGSISPPLGRARAVPLSPPFRNQFAIPRRRRVCQRCRRACFMVCGPSVAVVLHSADMTNETTDDVYPVQRSELHNLCTKEAVECEQAGNDE
jgi:hypothetical protein